MNPSLTDYLKSGALYALPHHLISRIVFKLTRLKSPLVPKAIQLFSNVFKVNLDEALNPDPNSYATFNEFFTRELKPELRPIAATSLVSPVDGTISQVGNIVNGTLLQAKGISYSLERLLGNTE
jgi:phosphatidylserine decarboxylase